MKRIIIALVALFLMSGAVLAQEPQDSAIAKSEKVARNAVYLTGSAFLAHAQAYLTYERLILNGTSTDLWLRGSLGRWTSLWGDGTTYGFTANLLLGEGDGRWSFELGFAHIPGYQEWQETSSDFAPLGTIAFRYQPEEGDWLFKVGVGYPEFLILGVGYAF